MGSNSRSDPRTSTWTMLLTGLAALVGKTPVELQDPTDTVLQLTRMAQAEARLRLCFSTEFQPRRFFMKSKTLTSALRVLSLLLLVSAVCTFAQARRPVHFSGVINDYSPFDPTIMGSPYEMHGQWSLDLHEWGTADFSVDMTMSDYGMTNGVFDATKGGQGSHTHHIRLTNIKITPGILGCPQFGTNPVTGGFQITRPGQSGDREWKHRPLRSHNSAYIDSARLHHGRKRNPVLEHDDAVRRASCDEAFRDAAYPWRRE